MAIATVPAPAASEWNVEALDLDAYLARIGYDGPRDNSHRTLRAMHRAHLEAMSWETIDAIVWRDSDLAMSSIQEKIVQRGYGGVCLESNLLFAAACEQLGFPVVRYLARAIRGEARIRLRAHVVLAVEADGRTWMADVGFGDEGLLEPIPFVDGATATVGGWTWRLDHAEDGTWTLRCRHPESWFDVYSLREEVHHHVDFEVARHWCFHRPPFSGQLIAQRPEEHVRYVLQNQRLLVTRSDGTREVHRLEPDEVIETLRTTFRIPVTAEDEAEILVRLPKLAAQH